MTSVEYLRLKSKLEYVTHACDLNEEDDTYDRESEPNQYLADDFDRFETIIFVSDELH